MKQEIIHLWNKIDNYEDKEIDILNIFNDAELAFLIAIDNQENEKKLKEYKTKLGEIKSLMQETPFGFDIWQLHSWIEEFKFATYWRDNLKIDGIPIKRKEIKKWCYEVYNTLRYYLLSTGAVDLNIGESGKQPEE